MTQGSSKGVMRNRGKAGDGSGFLGHRHGHPQPCPATFSPAQTYKAVASGKSDISSSCRHPGRLFRVKTVAERQQAGRGLMKAEGWPGGFAYIAPPPHGQGPPHPSHLHGEIWTCYCTSMRWYQSCQLPALMGQESSLPPAAPSSPTATRALWLCKNPRKQLSVQALKLYLSRQQVTQKQSLAPPHQSDASTEQGIPTSQQSQLCCLGRRRASSFSAGYKAHD